MEAICCSAAWVELDTKGCPEHFQSHYQGTDWGSMPGSPPPPGTDSCCDRSWGRSMCCCQGSSSDSTVPTLCSPDSPVHPSLLQGSEWTPQENTPEIRDSECAKQVWGIKELFYLLFIHRLKKRSSAVVGRSQSLESAALSLNAVPALTGYAFWHNLLNQSLSFFIFKMVHLMPF